MKQSTKLLIKAKIEGKWTVILREEYNGNLAISGKRDIHITNIAMSVFPPLTQVFLTKMPTRIDYDSYLQKLWLMDEESVYMHPEPYKLLTNSQSTTIWTKERYLREMANS